LKEKNQKTEAHQLWIVRHIRHFPGKKVDEEKAKGGGWHLAASPWREEWVNPYTLVPDSDWKKKEKKKRTQTGANKSKLG
jgi:hypothetical protein